MYKSMFIFLMKMYLQYLNPSDVRCGGFHFYKLFYTACLEIYLDICLIL